MGATIRTYTEETILNARDTFKQLTSRLKQEHGDNDYNGTLSTCSLTKVTQNNNKNSKKEETTIFKNINADFINKWDAHCYDLGIVGYELTEITFEKPQKLEKVKYKKQIAVKYIDHNGFNKEVICENMKLAQQKSLELINKNYSVNDLIETYIAVDGNPLLAKVRVSKKIVKNEPKKLKETQSCKAIHKYYFIGQVAE